VCGRPAPPLSLVVDRRSYPAPAKSRSACRTAVSLLAYHRLVRDIQTALREQIFNIEIAECEANIEPNSVPDDRRGN
jgi:hypothetical protein